VASASPAEGVGCKLTPFPPLPASKTFGYIADKSDPFQEEPHGGRRPKEKEKGQRQAELQAHPPHQPQVQRKTQPKPTYRSGPAGLLGGAPPARYGAIGEGQGPARGRRSGKRAESPRSGISAT